jgi:tetratricopeptide (TPR) repeat protein
MGRPADAIVHMRRAQQLDPLSTIIGADTAKVLIDARRYDEAIEECRRMLELDPAFRPARGWLITAHIWKGMYQQAETEMEALDEGQETADAYLDRAFLYASSGNPGKAAEWVLKFRRMAERGQAQAWQMALLYILVQPDTGKAFDWLRRAYDERNAYLMAVKVAPDFDRVRSDPRFQDLIRRMNFLD